MYSLPPFDEYEKKKRLIEIKPPNVCNALYKARSSSSGKIVYGFLDEATVERENGQDVNYKEFVIYTVLNNTMILIDQDSIEKVPLSLFD